MAERKYHFACINTWGWSANLEYEHPMSTNALIENHSQASLPSWQPKRPKFIEQLGRNDPFWVQQDSSRWGWQVDGLHHSDETKGCLSVPFWRVILKSQPYLSISRQKISVGPRNDLYNANSRNIGLYNAHPYCRVPALHRLDTLIRVLCSEACRSSLSQAWRQWLLLRLTFCSALWKLYGLWRSHLLLRLMWVISKWSIASRYCLPKTSTDEVIYCTWSRPQHKSRFCTSG